MAHLHAHHFRSFRLFIYIFLPFRSLARKREVDDEGERLKEVFFLSRHVVFLIRQTNSSYFIFSYNFIEKKYLSLLSTRAK